MNKYLNLRPNIALGLIFAFLVNIWGPLPGAQAQEFVLPAPGVMVYLSPPLDPPILKGVKIHPDNPFRFDFILDQGDYFSSSVKRPNVLDGNPFGQADGAKQSQKEQQKQEATRLIKYFLVSLTIPEKDLWVNLSPYEKDRIIPNSFGLTEMGRDLLAEDYMLKQITASLIYPEDTIGKKFWKRIYEESEKKFGTTNIPVNTFNKVWIVPDKAVVYENAKAGTAYVVESKLKVMLEQDYLALSHNVIPAKAGIHDTSVLGSQIVREIVIPELTKEVNEGKNFSQLRQVYNSLILATWYKKKIKDSILEQVYMDKNKTAGVQYSSTVIPAKAGIQKRINSDMDPRFRGDDVDLIYQRYLQAFKKGVYNYIKEEIDPITQQTIPRKYFSGGISWGAANLDHAMSFTTSLNDLHLRGEKLSLVQARFDSAMSTKPEEPPTIAGLPRDKALALIDPNYQKSISGQFVDKDSIRLPGGVTLEFSSLSKFPVDRQEVLNLIIRASKSLQDRILSIGEGKGHLTQELKNHGFKNVFGMDIMEEFAKAAFARSGTSQFVGSAYDMPFADEEFRSALKEEGFNDIRIQGLNGQPYVLLGQDRRMSMDLFTVIAQKKDNTRLIAPHVADAAMTIQLKEAINPRKFTIYVDAFRHGFPANMKQAEIDEARRAGLKAPLQEIEFLESQLLKDSKREPIYVLDFYLSNNSYLYDIDPDTGSIRATQVSNDDLDISKLKSTKFVVSSDDLVHEKFKYKFLEALIENSNYSGLSHEELMGMTDTQEKIAHLVTIVNAPEPAHRDKFGLPNGYYARWALWENPQTRHYLDGELNYSRGDLSLGKPLNGKVFEENIRFARAERPEKLTSLKKRARRFVKGSKGREAIDAFFQEIVSSNIRKDSQESSPLFFSLRQSRDRIIVQAGSYLPPAQDKISRIYSSLFGTLRPFSNRGGLHMVRDLARIAGGDINFGIRHGWAVFELELPAKRFSSIHFLASLGRKQPSDHAIVAQRKNDTAMTEQSIKEVIAKWAMGSVPRQVKSLKGRLRYDLLGDHNLYIDGKKLKKEGDGLHNDIFSYRNRVIRVNYSQDEWLWKEAYANFQYLSQNGLSPMPWESGFIRDDPYQPNFFLVVDKIIGKSFDKFQTLNRQRNEMLIGMIRELLLNKIKLEGFKPNQFMIGYNANDPRKEIKIWLVDADTARKREDLTVVDIARHYYQEVKHGHLEWTKFDTRSILDYLQQIINNPDRLYQEDQAMVSFKDFKENGRENTGGIDFNVDKMNLQVKMDSHLHGNDSKGIKFHLDPAMLAQLQNAPGFVPVIINIQPLKSLSEFLEIAST